MEQIFLKDITLTNIGPFSTIHVPFSSALTLLYGDNEAGKSTLFESFFGILSGFPPGSRFEKDPRLREASGKVRLASSSHGEISIERFFAKDKTVLSTPQGVLFEGIAPFRGRGEQFQEYLNKLRQIFSVGDHVLIRALLSMEPRDFSAKSTSCPAILTEVFERNYSKIVEKMEEEFYSLTKQSPEGTTKRNDRELEVLKKKKEILEKELRISEEFARTLGELRETVCQCEKEIGEGEREKKKLWQELQWLKMCERAVRDLQQLDFELDHVEVQRTRWQEIEQVRRALLEARSLNRNFFYWLGGAVLSFAFLSFWLLHKKWLALGIFLGGAASLFLLGLWSLRQKKEKQKKKDELSVRASLLEKREVLEKKKKDLIQWQAEILTRIKAEEVTVPEMLIKLERERQNLGSFLQEVMELARKKENDHFAWEAKLSKLQRVRTEKSYQLHEISLKWKSPEMIQEELSDVESRKNDLEFYTMALWKAISGLKDAIATFQKDYLFELETIVTEEFSVQTGILGRTISLSNEWEPELTLAPLGKVDTLILSDGAQDLLFLLLKLAFGELVARQTALPLLLDDVTAGLDNRRLEAFWQFLKDLSRMRQIIVFTHRLEEVRIAKSVAGKGLSLIELPPHLRKTSQEIAL